MNVLVVLGVVAVAVLWRYGKGAQLGAVIEHSGDLNRRVSNVYSIGQRVKHIIDLVKRQRYTPDVIFRARSIVSQKCGEAWCTPEKDWRAECVAVFDYFRKNVRYTRDPWNLDLFESSRLNLKFAGGDCDSYVIAIAEHLQALGYPIKLRVVQTTNPASEDYDHIYLLAGYRAKSSEWIWFSLDASVDMPAGWEIPREMIKTVGGKPKIRDYDIPATRMAAA